jgi:protein AbiQ
VALNGEKGAVIPLPSRIIEMIIMAKLNFYTVDLDYINYLKRSEHEKRGFSRVPNMEYGEKHKPKFLCGVVLQVNNTDYYVPVTSYKQQQPDNFLIKADNGEVVSSLRFNYMFPVPNSLIAVRSIANEPDRAYRSLLSQEMQYCIKNQDQIQHLAERTYKRVLLGKNQGLVNNSCDFPLLEQKCLEYIVAPEKNPELTEQPAVTNHENKDAPVAQKVSMKERFAEAQAKADLHNEQHHKVTPQTKER